MGKSSEDHHAPQTLDPLLVRQIGFHADQDDLTALTPEHGGACLLILEKPIGGRDVENHINLHVPSCEAGRPGRQHSGISATGKSIPTLFAHTQNLRRQRAGSTPKWKKLGWGLLTATQPTFPFPLRQSMNSYTSETLLSCNPFPRFSLTISPLLSPIPFDLCLTSPSSCQHQTQVYSHLGSQHPHNEQPVLSDHVWQG